MDAKDQPVRGRPRKEVSTQDFGDIERRLNPETYQPEPIALLDGDGALSDEAEYQAELSFMEEPVTIYIQPAATQNPATTVQCWVNAKGAEHLNNVNGIEKWSVCGWLPVGHEVTTKRKYVEVLARSRRGHVETFTNNMDSRPDGGLITRKLSSEIVFSILHDANPKGREWFSRIMREQ